MKSLRLKLVLLFFISVLLVVFAGYSMVEYKNYRNEERDATLLMEVGPAFVNGATVEDLEKQGLEKDENIHSVIADRINELKITPTYVIQNFHPVADLTKTGNSVSVFPVKGTTDTYLLDMAHSEVGDLVVTENYFARTIDDYSRINGWRRFYYLTVEDYPDLVILASLDVRFLPQPSSLYWLKQAMNDFWITFPFVVLLSLLLGWIISRWTIGPIVKITGVANRLGENNLDERVSVESNDEIGSLARSMNRMADKIQAAFTIQKRFVSDAAHELKTPIASMKTSVTAALDSDNTIDEYRQLLIFLSSRISVQEELIAALLFLASVDEHHIYHEYEVTDLADVIRETDEVFTYLFEEKGVRLEIEPCADIFIGAGFQVLFRLLSNLLDNALKNTPPGGLVQVKIVKCDTCVFLDVSDTGKGIPPNCINSVFERFYKTPDSGTGGFGLGLAICKSIVESSGGTISVTSRQGSGSVFRVALPLCDTTRKNKV